MSKQEQLYYVPLGVKRYTLSGKEMPIYLYKINGNISVDWSPEEHVTSSLMSEYYQFTQKEIEDFNPLYMSFAVKVEEFNEVNE